MNNGQALLELTIMNTQHKNATFEDAAINALNFGIPPEIVTRLQALWSNTKVIAGEMIQIGKIIVMKILDFIKAHPSMAIGIAIGAVIGAFTAMIPLLGPLLAPLVTTVAVIYGAIKGSRMDSGNATNDLMSEAIELAKIFIALIVDIFAAINEQKDANKALYK